MRSSLAIAALALAACAGETTPAPTTGAPPRETPECATERAAILDLMAASRRDHACAAASDCALVTSPSHPDAEYDQVVFAADAPALDTRAEAHLARCGAFFHHEALDAYREITPSCAEEHCVAEETIVHVGE